MPVDRKHIGKALAGASLLITRSRLRHFAKATGQTDPTYTDVGAARTAGHRDLPVPPSFFTAVELEAPDPFAMVSDLGVDMGTVLHGEQQFQYREMAYAGDELSTSAQIVDIYARKGGALEFVVWETTVVNQSGTDVALLRSTLAINNNP